MKENDLLRWVLDVAARTGWLAKHVPAPMRAIGGNRFVPETRAKGILDLLLVHEDPPRIIFAELKDEDGQLTAEQVEMMRALRRVADSLRTHLHAVTELLATAGLRSELTDLRHIPIGVYLWRPGMEKLIETTLKSKVLTP